MNGNTVPIQLKWTRRIPTKITPPLSSAAKIHLAKLLLLAVMIALIVKVFYDFNFLFRFYFFFVGSLRIQFLSKFTNFRMKMTLYWVEMKNMKLLDIGTIGKLIIEWMFGEFLFLSLLSGFELWETSHGSNINVFDCLTEIFREIFREIKFP